MSTIMSFITKIQDTTTLLMKYDLFWAYLAAGLLAIVLFLIIVYLGYAALILKKNDEGTGLISVAAILVFAFAMMTVVALEDRVRYRDAYDRAVVLEMQEDFQGALKIYEALPDDYKDTTTRIEGLRIPILYENEEGKIYSNEDEILKGISVYLECGDYKNSKAKVKTLIKRYIEYPDYPFKFKEEGDGTKYNE